MIDEYFAILANTHRRQILTSLLEHGPSSVDYVTRNGESDRNRQQKRIALRHVHLPKLEDCGLIDWNRKANSVAKGPRFDDIKPLLTLLVRQYDGFADERVVK